MINLKVAKDQCVAQPTTNKKPRQHDIDVCVCVSVCM